MDGHHHIMIVDGWLLFYFSKKVFCLRHELRLFIHEIITGVGLLFNDFPSFNTFRDFGLRGPLGHIFFRKA